MLGTALASQYAGWWQAQGNASISVTMTGSAALGYKVSQSPAYSWRNIPELGNGTPGTSAVLAPGNIAAGNVASSSTYNNNRWTQVFTVAVDYPSGLTNNQGFKYDQKFDGGGGNFTSNFAWVANGSGNLQVNAPQQNSVTLPGAIGDYNNKFITVVSSVSNTAASYTSWAGTGSGNYYSRMAVFDTETGALLAKSDSVDNNRTTGMPTDFATWISSAGNNISTVRNDAYAWSIEPSGPTVNCNMRVSGIWATYGEMFDPLTEANTSWRTTRPSATIGNALAWFNGQFANYGNTTGYVEAWGNVSSQDRFTPQTSPQQIDLIQYSGNSTVFNDRYSDTIVPISIG